MHYAATTMLHGPLKRMLKHFPEAAQMNNLVALTSDGSEVMFGITVAHIVAQQGMTDVLKMILEHNPLVVLIEQRYTQATALDLATPECKALIHLYLPTDSPHTPTMTRIQHLCNIIDAQINDDIAVQTDDLIKNLDALFEFATKLNEQFPNLFPELYDQYYAFNLMIALRGRDINATQSICDQITRESSLYNKAHYELGSQYLVLASLAEHADELYLCVYDI